MAESEGGAGPSGAARSMRGFATAEGRATKALKIEAVLMRHLRIAALEGRKVLDIGCGSGHIAAHFAQYNQVSGVDVVDQVSPPVRGRFEFQLVSSETLPFSDGSFDIVLSNHVVAYLRDPRLHTREIARVLRADGVAYFATPNRYFPLEPHSHAPFVHYLPGPMNRWMLRLITGRAEHVRVQGYAGMRRLFREAGLRAHEYTMAVARDPTNFHFAGVPRPWLPEVCSVIAPTNIFVLTR